MIFRSCFVVPQIFEFLEFDWTKTKSRQNPAKPEFWSQNPKKTRGIFLGFFCGAIGTNFDKTRGMSSLRPKLSYWYRVVEGLTGFRMVYLVWPNSPPVGHNFKKPKFGLKNVVPHFKRILIKSIFAWIFICKLCNNVPLTLFEHKRGRLQVFSCFIQVWTCTTFLLFQGNHVFWSG